MQQAVQTYRNTLTVHTREKAPLDWATTQSNLGGAFLALFNKSGDQADLDRSEAYTREAQKVFEQTATHYAGMAQGQLDEIAARRG